MTARQHPLIWCDGDGNLFAGTKGSIPLPFRLHDLAVRRRFDRRFGGAAALLAIFATLIFARGLPWILGVIANG